MLTRMMAGEMYTDMKRRRSETKTGEGISEGMKGIVNITCHSNTGTMVHIIKWTMMNKSL